MISQGSLQARGAAAAQFASLGALACALSLGAALAPSGALAQSSDAPPAAEEPADESFGRTVGRVFSNAWRRSTDWLDPDGDETRDPDAMCQNIASEEGLEEDALQRFGSAVRAAWRPPAPRAAPDQVSIALEVCLGPQGRSLSRPRLLRPIGALEPDQATALLAALAAVEEAAPYSDPKGEYFPWRRVVVLFDAERGAGAAAIGAPNAEERLRSAAPPTSDADPLGAEAGETNQ